jgi:tetratricopeptide (TPR) repeat protein
MFVHRSQVERAGQRNSKIDAGWHGQEVADLLRTTGQLEESDALYQELVSGFEEAESRGDLVDTLTAWGNVQIDRGQLEEAERSYRRALQIAEEVGNRRRAAYARLDLANVSIERGHPEPVTALESMVAAFREQQAVYGECYAQYVLARARRSLGDGEQAMEAIERAEALSALLREHNRTWIEWHQGRHLKGWVALEAARIRKDIEALTALRAGAERIGRVGNAFAARLVLAEISPPSESRRRALQELEREAREKGFLHIARKAAALRS